MVTTKVFNITRNTYFNIMLAIYWKKRWWLILLMIAVAFLSLSSDLHETNFAFIFLLAYPILIVYRLWSFANDKENAGVYLPRYFEIDNSNLIAYGADVFETKLSLSGIIKYIKLNNCYMLYMSKNQHIYLPKDAFKTYQDREWFEQAILSKIKKG